MYRSGHLLWAAALAGLFLPAPAGAAGSDTSPSVTQDQPLSFGTVAATASGGTITVRADGSIACLDLGCYGGAHPGLLHIVGGDAYGVQISVASTILTNADDATLALSLTPASPTLILRPDRARTPLSIGGQLRIRANQPQGNYSGSYEVTVEYQ